MNKRSSWLHFKYYRIIEWLSFLIRLPYHLIFHSFDEMADGYRGYTIRGFIICDCDYVIDLGVSYGMHCEECYNRVKWLTEKRITKLNSTLHSNGSGDKK